MKSCLHSASGTRIANKNALQPPRRQDAKQPFADHFDPLGGSTYSTAA